MDHHQVVKLGSTGMNRIVPTTSLRHGALERLRFIDARLFWEARINRADLIETFSVSPAQAALDFKEYLKMAGRGVVYDTRSKAYVRATSFKPAFGAPDAGKALSDMLAAGNSLVATLPKLERPLDPWVVARVRLAARSAERLRCRLSVLHTAAAAEEMGRAAPARQRWRACTHAAGATSIAIGGILSWRA